MDEFVSRVDRPNRGHAGETRGCQGSRRKGGVRTGGGSGGCRKAAGSFLRSACQSGKTSGSIPKTPDGVVTNDPKSYRVLQHLPVARDPTSTGQAPFLHEAPCLRIAVPCICILRFRACPAVPRRHSHPPPGFWLLSGLLTPFPKLALRLHLHDCVSRSVRLETGRRVKGSPVSGWIKGFRVDPGFRKDRLAHLLAWVVNVS
jgi:hypothetical protein